MQDRRARSVLEIPVMPQAKDVPQQKRRRKGVPVLGAAGLSLSLASGASAAVGGVSAHLLARTPPVSQQMTLHDEEISDISLATFRVFDKENTQCPPARLTMGAGCGCACGSSFYYNPPAYPPPPPPLRPTNKYRRSPKST
jgi:hypothetical protein